MFKEPTVRRAAQAVCVLLFLAATSATGQRISHLKSPFGETPPSAPALFEPGLISIAAATTYRPAFTPDGRTVYYTMEVGSDYVILVSRWQNGHWTRPEI